MSLDYFRGFNYVVTVILYYSFVIFQQGPLDASFFNLTAEINYWVFDAQIDNHCSRSRHFQSRASLPLSCALEEQPGIPFCSRKSPVLVINTQHLHMVNNKSNTQYTTINLASNITFCKH